MRANEKPRQTRVKHRDLPRNSSIDKSLTVLQNIYPENVEYCCFLALMVLSGRRQKDLRRLKWEAIKIKEEVIHCILPRDKANRTEIVSFSLKLSEWDLNWDISIFERWLSNGIENKQGLCFEKTFKQNRVSANCSFKIHSCRSRKAIVLLIKGETAETIKSRIGWRDMQSVLRYVKLSIDMIRKFKSYEDLLNFIFEI